LHGPGDGKTRRVRPEWHYRFLHKALGRSRGACVTCCWDSEIRRMRAGILLPVLPLKSRGLRVARRPRPERAETRGRRGTHGSIIDGCHQMLWSRQSRNHGTRGCDLLSDRIEATISPRVTSVSCKDRCRGQAAIALSCASSSVIDTPLVFSSPLAVPPCQDGFPRSDWQC
jgi:hypothetical protein